MMLMNHVLAEVLFDDCAAGQCSHSNGAGHDLSLLRCLSAHLLYIGEVGRWFYTKVVEYKPSQKRAKVLEASYGCFFQNSLEASDVQDMDMKVIHRPSECDLRASGARHVCWQLAAELCCGALFLLALMKVMATCCMFTTLATLMQPESVWSANQSRYIFRCRSLVPRFPEECRAAIWNDKGRWAVLHSDFRPPYVCFLNGQRQQVRFQVGQLRQARESRMHEGLSDCSAWNLAWLGLGCFGETQGTGLKTQPRTGMCTGEKRKVGPQILGLLRIQALVIASWRCC